MNLRRATTGAEAARNCLTLDGRAMVRGCTAIEVIASACMMRVLESQEGLLANVLAVASVLERDKLELVFLYRKAGVHCRIQLPIGCLHFSIRMSRRPRWIQS